MSVLSKFYAFNDDNIAISPTNGGVYSLHESGETIYIGKGDGENGIRERLQAHKRGDEGLCMGLTTAYRREVCSNLSMRVTELLEEYYQINNRLPRCN